MLVRCPMTPGPSVRAVTAVSAMSVPPRACSTLRCATAMTCVFSDRSRVLVCRRCRGKRRPSPAPRLRGHGPERRRRLGAGNLPFSWVREGCVKPRLSKASRAQRVTTRIAFVFAGQVLGVVRVWLLPLPIRVRRQRSRHGLCVVDGRRVRVAGGPAPLRHAPPG